ncbi:glycosyltransferase [candidate division KSB1 bacterium]|nr:glycosyltransferase [candidate division KSB1 bacterium]NIR71321.1 glycosyltransferase [candidate division KSB1 bacterium]NIS24831.1 glycosyltransferase [candidate division KSB1 bacterium]NIT71751.1 glycosyltransferase [candidate division KSB1 bacterium]NIU25466.1 glycosyltransferase [candidate division KSB1 bacterium]
MSGFEFSLVLVYAVIIAILALFGLHKYYLLFLYLKYKNRPRFKPGKFDSLPKVTVQLPIYNEKYVMERLLKAVCLLDYPKALLEVQVLDDSTDETQAVARKWVDFFRRQGFDIKYLRRTNREGFKAGALEAGLKKAEGEFIAIFDADFVPKPDFLIKSIPYFANKEVGMVQARWGHINQNYSLLTQLQSVFLDGHFVIEHTARNRSGRFFNFNGTAGIWRKKAIESAGGWQHDTLTEDLDLSYRAQIAGWQFAYLPDVVAPSELPVEMNAYKSQQHRWAKGSIQTAKKLLPKIIKSDLPLKVKWEAVVHLVSNFSYLLMTVPSVLIFPVSIILFNIRLHNFIFIYLLLFFSATISIFVFYLVCQREVYSNWRQRLRYIPGIFALAIGLSVNNSKAVLEALINHKTEFKRTPKFKIESKGDGWRNKIYVAEKNFLPFLELILGIYFTFSVYFALKHQVYMSIPFFVLFQFGFLYISIISFFQFHKG